MIEVGGYATTETRVCWATMEVADLDEPDNLQRLTT